MAETKAAAKATAKKPVAKAKPAAKKRTIRRTSSASKAAAQVFRAKEPAAIHVSDEEGSISFVKGELVRGDHKVFKLAGGAYRDLFEPVDDFDRPEVEQATAAPGEKR